MGTSLGGVGSILNKFSLHVITEFVRQYNRYHKDANILDTLTSHPGNIISSGKEPSPKPQQSTPLVRALTEKQNKETKKNKTGEKDEEKKSYEPSPPSSNHNMNNKRRKRGHHSKKMSIGDKIIAQYNTLNTLALNTEESDEEMVVKKLNDDGKI